MVIKLFKMVLLFVVSFGSILAMEQCADIDQLTMATQQLIMSDNSLKIKTTDDKQIPVPGPLVELLRSQMNFSSDEQTISVGCEGTTINNLLNFMNEYADSFNHYFASSDKTQALDSLLATIDIEKARRLNCKELGTALNQLGLQKLKKFFVRTLRTDLFALLSHNDTRDLRPIIEASVRMMNNPDLKKLFFNLASRVLIEGVQRIDYGHVPISACAISHGKCAYALGHKNYIEIINAKTGKHIETIFSANVNTLTFSPCENYLASGSENSVTNIWDVTTGERLKTFIGHKGCIFSVCFSPCTDSFYVATASSDKTIKLWNFKTGQLIKTFVGHTHDVNCISFSPCGNYLVSGSDDFTCKIWDVATGECTKTFSDHLHIRSVCFSPCGRFVASGTLCFIEKPATVKLWDCTSGNCLKTLTGHNTGIIAMAFSPCGTYLCTGSYDCVKFWNIEHGKEYTVRTDPIVRSGLIYLSSCGNYLASTANLNLLIYDISFFNTLSTYLFQNSKLYELPLLQALAKTIDDKNEITKEYILTPDQQAIFNQLGGNETFGKELRKMLNIMIANK